jgi:hypothetical protein
MRFLGGPAGRALICGPDRFDGRFDGVAFDAEGLAGALDGVLLGRSDLRPGGAFEAGIVPLYVSKVRVASVRSDGRPSTLPFAGAPR